MWRGGGAVERTGLENRRPFTGPVSSNLTLSANCVVFLIHIRGLLSSKGIDADLATSGD